ncbi:hypothetical protein DFJ74DRAFT_753206, partial [Hyaloraphidium curvatum]
SLSHRIQSLQFAPPPPHLPRQCRRSSLPPTASNPSASAPGSGSSASASSAPCPASSRPKARSAFPPQPSRPSSWSRHPRWVSRRRCASTCSAYLLRSASTRLRRRARLRFSWMACPWPWTAAALTMSGLKKPRRYRACCSSPSAARFSPRSRWMGRRKGTGSSELDFS